MFKEFIDFLNFEKEYGFKILFKDIININKLYLQNYYLNKILKFGKDNNQRYTFFIRTKDLSRKKSIIKKTIKLGHEIGVHGYNHINLTKLKEEKFKEEISNSVNELYRIGLEPNGFRAPFLLSNNNVKRVLKKFGYKYCSDTKSNKKIIRDVPVIRPYDWEALIVKNLSVNNVIKIWKNNKENGTFLFHPWIIGNHLKIFKELLKPDTDYRIISNKKNSISFDVY